MSQIQERPLTGEERVEFSDFSARAWKLLGLRASETEPEIAVEAVNRWVDDYQSKRRGFLGRFRKDDPQMVDFALGLGAVWGDQIVRKLGWEWTCVLDKGRELYGVASPDRSLVIYPTYFLKECLADPNKDCTALLAFNMLVAGTLPAFEAGGFENLMNGVARVVPKR